MNSYVKETSWQMKEGLSKDVLKKDHQRRRKFGEHLTSVSIFKKFIFPQIEELIYDYCWVDLYAGEGNLVLPILNEIPRVKRVDFFKKHIFLFDIQEQMVEKSIKNAEKYGIPRNVACKNIQRLDTLKKYPEFTKCLDFPVFHITNPPYLYIGYIVKNSSGDTKKALAYFQDQNVGLQDLYQIALMNDLRKQIYRMIYIIPSNFFFGSSVSNKFRKEFLPFYNIKNAFIFEKKIFAFTGTNVSICHFERKKFPKKENIEFIATKYNHSERKKKYILKPENNFRAGDGFEEFINKYKCSNPLKIYFYLTNKDVEENKGNFDLRVIDSNKYCGNSYQTMTIKINGSFYEKVKNNPLFIRTVDTGSNDGRAGLFYIEDVYEVEGIVATKAKYRTHPIQLLINPSFNNKKDIELLKRYFNFIIEYFRATEDSEFLTTYKYSDSGYVRKYFGLSQARKIIETFPINVLKGDEKERFEELVLLKEAKFLFEFLDSINNSKKIFDFSSF